MVCITGMFHRHSVEHKLTRRGTAVNVPRDVPQAGNHERATKVLPSLLSEALMYYASQAIAQAHDSNGRFKRTHGITHGHMNSAQTNSVHTNSTRHGTGGRGSRPAMIVTLPSINQPHKKWLKGVNLLLEICG